MAVKIKPLTKAQLVGYFADYRAAFADWDVEHDVVLVRSQGPLKQYIAFEALRAGSYRPSCSVEVLIAPASRLLTRFLDIKHREVLPREHAEKLPRVLKAMEAQFLPAIRQPLKVEEVLRLAEEEVLRDNIQNLHYSNGLAALYAHVGDADHAIQWCDRVDGQIAALGRAQADWEQRQEIFARELRAAIRCGEVRAFLDRQIDPQAD